MEESKRQKQVARLIQEEMTLIFQKEGLNMVDGGMLSIAQVQVTPDLLEARFFLSFFNVQDADALLAKVIEQTPELRHQLGNKLRHQLRRIPELQFFKDDTLDHAFKMEALLKKIKDGGNGTSSNEV
ncbi:MAG TPA: 30S ribosome-binding factor RbfA [Edaphocola sp.]|nr:30S ribosome-binding factor RbfA [Edaphocola sp.]